MPSNFSASKPKLFLSDAHLGKFSEEKNEQLETELIHVVDYAQKNQIELHILGDLFDFWIEYPGYIPDLGQQLLKRFQTYHQQMNSTLYITGNHDNWTLGHFAECGFDVEPDSRTMALAGQDVLLLHGDGLLELPEGSLNRPLSHRLIRNRYFLALYRGLLPPAAGLWTMKQFSRLTDSLDEPGYDTSELDHWAEKTLKHSGFDVIICGHDHQPRKKKYPFGTYYNLGTFHYHKTLLFYNNQKFNFVKWSDSKRSLTPFPV